MGPITFPSHPTMLLTQGRLAHQFSCRSGGFWLSTERITQADTEIMFVIHVNLKFLFVW